MKKWRISLRKISRWGVICLLVGTQCMLVFSSQSVSAAGTLVQKSTLVVATQNVNSVTGSLPVAATPGNLIVVVCSAGFSTTLSVAGYTTANTAAGTISQGVFYKIAAAGNISATCSSSVRSKNGQGIQIYEYSGVLSGSVFDKVTNGTGTTSAIALGPLTPATNNSLIFTAYTAASSASYTVNTAGYTERTDTLSTLHFGQADLFTTNTTAQSFSATNSANVAWRGQMVIFRIDPGSLSADVVDGSGVSVPVPSLTFTNKDFSFGCQAVTATFGTSTQKIRVSNTTSSPAWDLSIAATDGTTALWSSGAVDKYDYDDSTTSGCTDGGDTDAFAGQLTINPSIGTITPQSGCTNSGISLGALNAFNDGVTSAIIIATGSASAGMNCYWDITGVGVSQMIPAEQVSGTYTIGLTLTITAK